MCSLYLLELDLRILACVLILVRVPAARELVVGTLHIILGGVNLHAQGSSCLDQSLIAS